MHELKVSLENIIPLTYARDHFSQIVAEVQRDKLFILTKGGKPAVAIVDVKYLESITGGQIQEKSIQTEIDKNPTKVGLPPMVEHPSTAQTPPVVTPPKPSGFAAPTPPPKEEPKPIIESKPFENPPSAPLPQSNSGQFGVVSQAKPFKNPPSTPLGASQAKPAGFAAPMPEPKPEPKKEEMIDVSASNGFDSKPKPPPTTPPPPPPKPIEEKKDDDTLIMPEGPKKEPMPNQPLVNLPPVNTPAPIKPSEPKAPSQSDIDVSFTPDESENEELAKSKGDPDDSNNPAQYDGEDNPSEKEPEDMALD